MLAIFRGGSEHREMSDPEPGRCRRTDGKKWRCHQSVIPNQKYCEKHMHRGRKRSRKLVEASPYSRTPNLINSNAIRAIKPKFPENVCLKGPTNFVVEAPCLTSYPAKSNNNPSNGKFPENLHQNRPTGVVMRAPGLNNFTAKSNEKDKRNNSSSNDTSPEFAENLYQNGPTMVMMRTPGLTTCTTKSNENNKPNNEAKSDNVANERIALLNRASGLDFSPKSVLQSGKSYAFCLREYFGCVQVSFN